MAVTAGRADPGGRPAADAACPYRTPGAWAAGVDRVYEALSRAVVAASPVPLTGRLIVDLGAGTGATTRAIAAAGGRPVALDLSYPMLAHRGRGRPPAAVADIAALPLADASVGGALSAFSLSHVEDPGAVLAEAARVTAAGGPVLAAVFADTGARHPAAEIVDQVARAWGWAPPPWYRRLKRRARTGRRRPGRPARPGVGRRPGGGHRRRPRRRRRPRHGGGPGRLAIGSPRHGPVRRSPADGPPHRARSRGQGPGGPGPLSPSG